GRRVERADALRDAAPGDRAVRADEIGAALGHAAEHGEPDLHRRRIELALDAVSAVVAGAALDRLDLGAGNPFQRLARLLADVLHARVTGDVVADLAQRSAEIALEQTVTIA